jgi:HK97 family phage prohead protease
MSELAREWTGQVLLRAAGDPAERIIEGTIVPYGQVATVRDTPNGRPYRETIARGAMAGLDASKVRLEYVADPAPQQHNNHDGARLIGRGIAADLEGDGAVMKFRVSRTPLGDEAYELARDGVLTDLSVAFAPVSERRTSDGIVERTRIDLGRVALVASRGAYPGAQVTAVRAASEGTMSEDKSTAAEKTDEDEESEEKAPPKPHRTQATVTVDVDRAGVERETAQALSRAGSGPRVQVTRNEMVYRADATWSGRDDRGQRVSLLSDGWRARNGDMAAAERIYRWEMQRAEFETRAEMDARPLLERAGDVLSTEVLGAYPNDYVPGLLTPRILKGRPMGGFYERYPISDGLPKIYPKVTQSTVVVAQSAEAVNPTASDFGTTAVTVTPVLYGTETVVSRQVLDGSSPAAEAMVIADMIEAYAQASEAVIKTAVEAGSSASGVAIVAATPYAGILGNIVAYYMARFRAATGQFIPPALYPVLLAQADTTGRPLLPAIGPINSSGTTADGAVGASILGATIYLSYASTANVVVTGRPNDFVIMESPIARFSYDAVTGPAGVRVGVWAYLAVGQRLGSIKVTAA